VRVLFIGTPRSFIKEHVEGKQVYFGVLLVQIDIEFKAARQAVGDEVIFDAFVLKVLVDIFNVLKILQGKIQELIWRFV